MCHLFLKKKEWSFKVSRNIFEFSAYLFLFMINCKIEKVTENSYTLRDKLCIEELRIIAESKLRPRPILILGR